MRSEIFAWQHAVERRGQWRNEHITRAVHHLIQRGEPLRNEIMVRRERIVRQCFPIREQMRLEFGRKVRDFFQQSLRIQRIGGDDGDGFCLLRQLREKQRIAGTIEISVTGYGAGGW